MIMTWLRIQPFRRQDPADTSGFAGESPHQIPVSPFFSVFRIAASVAVLIAGVRGRAEMWPL
jgi:hypothetical protein